MDRPSIIRGTDALEARLRETADHLFGTDARHVLLGGKLLRPRVTLRGVSPDAETDPSDPMLGAALAVQLAHEASLLHDDVVDGAPIRRDRPTTRARDGAAAALIAGDRLLTLAYRAASSTRSPSFFEAFTRAVDRTVAGEARQGSLRGRVLTLEEYRAVIEDKSGALLGIALATKLLLASPESGADGHESRSRLVESARDLGVRIGALYQMVDDLLDYCPAARRGKPALNDFHQAKWTFPLAEIGHADPFDLTHAQVLDRLIGDPTAPPDERPIRRAMQTIHDEADAVVGALVSDLDAPAALTDEILGWVRRARAGILSQEERAAGIATLLPVGERRSDEAGESPPALARADILARAAVVERAAAAVRDRAVRLGESDQWPEFFGRHSRSFHFAARLFADEFRERVTGIYAFCRFTDDLVDQTDAVGPTRQEEVRARLDEWRRLVEASHDGTETGIPLLDQVVLGAGARGIPFSYLDELLNGVEMDIDPPEYPDLGALRVYTYRVASVVGGWITEELGVRNPGILDRAFALGHAMQTTNILRDVGEDIRAGRLYLPLDRMAVHGLLRSDLEAAARGRAPVPGGFVDLMKELMEYAGGEYRLARTGLHALPFRARTAVAVASRVYRGIHDEIRKVGYDSLTHRAYTTRGTKLRLAVGALLGVLPRASWRAEALPERSGATPWRPASHTGSEPLATALAPQPRPRAPSQETRSEPL